MRAGEIMDYLIMEFAKEGNIIIDQAKKLYIKNGAVRMSGNELVAVVEE